MAGYSRQSAAQIVNGEIVSAPPLNAEFNQVLAAFSASTGHKHDGTSNEGPPIALIADINRQTEIFINASLNQIDFKINVSSASVTQFSLVDGAILPTTDDDISLGSTTAEFKDLFLDGTANIDSLVADTADINAGTIDGVTIGGNSAGAGTFTTIAASSATIESGTINNTVIGGSTPVAGTFTALGATNVTVTGSASSIGAVAFTSTSATVTGDLTVSGSITASNITVVGSASSIGSVAITSSSATVTGNLSVSGSVTAASLTVTGNISASTITVGEITATGSASSIGSVAITSSSATISGALTVTGNITASTIGATNITVTGSASSIGSVAITTTGATVTGSLTVSGGVTASTIAATNITVTGSASSIGAATFTSTAVTITKMISGNVAITGGSITGVTNIFDPGSAMSYTFSGATADADPGNGGIRLNNASSTAATTIFIDNVDALSSADMTSFISLLSGGNSPSGVLGTVTLRKATFPEVFAQYSVTALTNASGYQKLTVANKGASGAAPFTSGDSLLVDIALTGDKGDAGDGDVSGPGSATDNAVVRFNGTTGSDIQNSGVIVDDSNNVTGVNALTVTTNITASNITIVGSASTIGSVAFTSTSATVTGNLAVTGGITASNITIVGSASSIGSLAITSTSATITGGFTVTGGVTASTIAASNITITGSASSIGAVAITSTTATVTGDLTVSGAITATTIGATNITVTGSASSIGAITITTTSVGINTSSVTSGTSLEVTGNMRITTTGNGLIFPDGSKQTAAASAGIGIGKAIAMALVFG